jgi:phosphoglycolate phosphatase-like HAD superfamily hydrolase
MLQDIDTIIFDLEGTLLDLSRISEGEKALIIPKDILEVAAKVYKLGVVSGGRRGEVFHALRATGLSPHFFDSANVVSREDVKEPKPAPEGLLLLASNLSSQQLLVVGDSENDRLSAEAAHFLFMWVKDFLAHPIGSTGWQ